VDRAALAPGDVEGLTRRFRGTETVAVFDGMNGNRLIESLKAYDAALRENGATALFVFGSRARGAERDDSDLDLFIDYDPAVKIPNMFRLMQIEEKISETLGIPVTITTRDALLAIRDCLTEIAILQEIAGRMTLQGFRNDPIARRAAAYAIQTISEAVRRIPDEWLADFAAQPWAQIKGIGNRLRHE
jgi:predicted nucleotidyltransferase